VIVYLEIIGDVVLAAARGTEEAGLLILGRRGALVGGRRLSVVLEVFLGRRLVLGR
jgi:hypothetical protein